MSEIFKYFTVRQNRNEDSHTPYAIHWDQIVHRLKETYSEKCCGDTLTILIEESTSTAERALCQISLTLKLTKAVFIVKHEDAKRIIKLMKNSMLYTIQERPFLQKRTSTNYTNTEFLHISLTNQNYIYYKINEYFV